MRPLARDARERMIEEHLGLVRSIARRFAQRNEPMEDLVQAGTIGLIKAVDRFDPRRGLPLARLAAPAIEGEIRHHLRDRVPHMRPPRRVRELDQRVRAAESRLAAELGRTPGLADIAPAVGADEDAVAEAIASRSLRMAVALPDIEDPSQKPEVAEARVLLAKGSKVLGERERRILELRFLRDLTQEEIAREVGLSQAHVSRLIQRALGRLRQSFGEEAPETTKPTQNGVKKMSSTPRASQREQRSSHSGRLLVRMPQSLHTDLVQAAEQEAVSLNTLITGMLASSVGWREPGAADPEPAPALAPAPAAPEPAPAASARPSGARRGWRSIVLVANLVTVALAAATALSLLVMALVGG